MTVAMWILSSLLVIAITLIVMGAAIRPYVDTIVKERNHWKLRAEVSEHEIEMTQANDVRLVNPIDPSATLDVFLQGIGDDDGANKRKDKRKGVTDEA